MINILSLGFTGSVLMTRSAAGTIFVGGYSVSLMISASNRLVLFHMLHSYLSVLFAAVLFANLVQSYLMHSFICFSLTFQSYLLLFYLVICYSLI